MDQMNGSRRDIIVIGASAGGVEALQELVGGLQPNLQAIVLYVWARAESFLPLLFSRAGPLPAEHPRDNDIPQYGRIYVAPPDLHLLIEDARMRLARGPRVIGILLTGYGGDGAAGLTAIDQLGGVTIVQDPAESQAPGMPQSALRVLKPGLSVARRGDSAAHQRNRPSTDRAGGTAARGARMCCGE